MQRTFDLAAVLCQTSSCKVSGHEATLQSSFKQWVMRSLPLHRLVVFGTAVEARDLAVLVEEKGHVKDLLREFGAVSQSRRLVHDLSFHKPKRFELAERPELVFSVVFNRLSKRLSGSVAEELRIDIAFLSADENVLESFGGLRVAIGDGLSRLGGQGRHDSTRDALRD